MISHFIRRRRVRQNNCNHIYEHYNFKISKTMVKSCQIEIGLQFPPFSTSYQFIWVFHLGSQPFFHNYCDDILSSHRSQSPSTRCKNDIYLSYELVYAFVRTYMSNQMLGRWCVIILFYICCPLQLMVYAQGSRNWHIKK